eukprot:Partr_v1_DN24889_c0_g1_i5_m29855 putative acyl-CoA synthetase family member 3
MTAWMINRLVASESLAIRGGNGVDFSYGRLFNDSHRLASRLGAARGSVEKPVGLLAPNSYSYVVGLFGAWMSGRAVVPLFPLHPVAEWDYVLADSGADMLLIDSSMKSRDRLFQLAVPVPVQTIPVSADNNNISHCDINIYPRSDALIVYTSGTTSRPKGVVHTHASLMSQVASITNAWSLTSRDHILHCLPLHHVHGIVNALLSPLSVGASVEFLPSASGDSMRPFDSSAVWSRLAGDRQKPAVSVFMGVPAMYAALETSLSSSSLSSSDLSRIDSQIRVWISGSSALPSSLSDRWLRLFPRGRILERYGMTEAGMILSNPLDGNREPVCLFASFRFLY